MENEFNQIIKIVENKTEKDQSLKKRRIETQKIDKIQLDENFLINYEDNPSVEKFREEYFKKDIPVIVDNQMQHWPATKNWRYNLMLLLGFCLSLCLLSVDYILEKAGNRTVPIEIGLKYTDTNWSQKLMTIKDFINKFILIDKSISGEDKGYLAQHPLFDQVRFF